MIQLQKPSTKQPTVKVQECCAGTRVPATASGTLSPNKHIGLRSECINQLDRWYSLLEKGAITQEKQYYENYGNGCCSSHIQSTSTITVE